MHFNWLISKHGFHCEILVEVIDCVQPIQVGRLDFDLWIEAQLAHSLVSVLAKVQVALAHRHGLILVVDDVAELAVRAGGYESVHQQRDETSTGSSVLAFALPVVDAYGVREHVEIAHTGRNFGQIT